MKMPTSENTKDENNKRDDGYDIEYYERTGGNQGAEISDIKRDIHSIKVQLTSNSRHSLISSVCIILLMGVILTLIGVILLKLNFVQPGSEHHDETLSSSDGIIVQYSVHRWRY